MRLLDLGHAHGLRTRQRHPCTPFVIEVGALNVQAHDGIFAHGLNHAHAMIARRGTEVSGKIAPNPNANPGIQVGVVLKIRRMDTVVKVIATAPYVKLMQSWVQESIHEDTKGTVVGHI